VFPHHGGDCSGANIVDFTNELCDLCKPETVIFSIGRNKHGNPRTDVISAVRKKIGNIKIACTQLSKNCADKISTTSPVHLNSFFSKGRANNECCGGTFIIELGDKIAYSPDFKSHLAFITAVASNPICIS
jgi:competence protein ComEC